MKTKSYKTVLLLFFTSSLLIAQNQNHRKIYNEEFNTNNDVVIAVNTVSTDVEIETWDKNEVSVEAIIEIEGVDRDNAERILDNWQFKAIGNKSEIEVLSKSSGFFSNKDITRIIVNGKQIEMGKGDYSFVLPELGNFHFFNNDNMELPELPEILEMPEMPDFYFENKIPKFDYEKYRQDKGYLKKWQKEMEKNLEKNKIVLGKELEKMENEKAVLKEDLEKMTEYQNRRAVEQRAMQKAQQSEFMKKRIAQQKERAQVRKKQAELRKDQIILKKGKMEEHKKARDEKRKIILSVLEDREKVKVKRKIIIKAPKDAKFKMNVKYGTLSFPN